MNSYPFLLTLSDRGVLTPFEMISGLGILLKGTLEERLKLSFDLYDLKEKGKPYLINRLLLSFSLLFPGYLNRGDIFRALKSSFVEALALLGISDIERRQQQVFYFFPFSFLFLILSLTHSLTLSLSSMSFFTFFPPFSFFFFFFFSTENSDSSCQELV